MSSTKQAKMRIDYLTSEEERQALYGGMCAKLNALISSLLGIIMLAASFLLLRNDRLRIKNYLNVDPDSGSLFFYKPFPDVLLGCAAATTAASIVQVMSSLMFIFEDITLGVWKWLKFTVLMVSSISVMLLLVEDYSDIHLYHFYFAMLVVNAVMAALFLSGDMLCICMKFRQSPTTVRTPY